MPHIIVEFSADLERSVDIPALIADIHRAALATGVFEIGAVRTRAERRDLYVVADGDPENGFVHITMRVAPGRDAATRKRVAGELMNAVVQATSEVYARSGLGLSVEVQEIDNVGTVRVNNLHDRMSARGLARPAVP